MLASVHVACHYGVVGAVEEDLAEEFDGLPFCHVAGGFYQDVVVFVEEEVEVGGEVLGDHGFVFGEEFLVHLVVYFENQEDLRTLNVVKASAPTSNTPSSIHLKNFHNTPFPLAGASGFIPDKPFALVGVFGSSYNMIAVAESLFNTSLSTVPAGVALSL